MITHLALDPGLTHTGVALAHDSQLVEGLTTISTPDPATRLSALLRLIKQHQPQAVIIGLPSRGPIRALSRSLARDLRAQLSLPVHLFLEDNSTRLAQAALLSGPTTSATRRARLHRAAAAAILETYLDTLLQ